MIAAFLKNKFLITSFKATFKIWGLVLLCTVYSTAFAQTDDDNSIPTEFIVMLKPGHKIEVLMQELESSAISNPATIKKCLSPRMGIYLLQRNTTNAADKFLLGLVKNENVKLAQFNHHTQPRSLVPNDPEFAQQWNMLNTGQNNGLVGADIDAANAWAKSNDNVTADGDTVVVAVIDFLFDLAHEDLNFFTNYNEIPGNSIDDDGNGYIDDVNGWNVFNDNGDVNGATAHSTHCAGIVGAIGNNGKGIAGVCWGTKILAVAGSSTIESEVVEAYDYVRNMRLLYNTSFGTKGAYIVATNSSFGADGGLPANYPIWCAMYDSMGAVGILSAAATTNSNTDVDVAGDMPTTCPSKWLITVTNTLRNDAKNVSAGYGKTSIDMGAPGTVIRSTVPNSSYADMTGTSMATPHVAGAIAAMYSAACKSLIDKYFEQPDTIALLIKDYLLDGAEWNSSLNNTTTTSGRLNLFRSISNLNKFNCDSCSFSAALNATPVTCKNANDGMAEISFSTGNAGDYIILWSDSFMFAGRQDIVPGFYTATITDTLSGCSQVVTAAFHNPDSITVLSLLSSPPGDGAPGNIVVQGKAVNEPLMYSIDGINYQSTSVFTVSDSGLYNVYIKNTTGCVVERTIQVGLPTGISDLENVGLQILLYPNPASDDFVVYAPQFAREKTPLQVFDVTGRKIFEATPTTERFLITTSTWNTGIYVVKVGGASRKLVIER